MTKLYHSKHDHLVNLYINSLENAKNGYISAQYEHWTISMKFGTMMQNVSQVHWPLKNFILKIQDGRRPISLTDLLCIITRYRDFSIFKMAAVRAMLDFWNWIF